MASNMIASFDETKLYLNKEVPDDCSCVAVIVHGLCEHQGRYDYLADMFHNSKIGTYRFDHRGHGRSEGERTYYKDYNEIADDVNVIVNIAIAENQNIPVFLVGHSMGGYAVALYGSKYTDQKISGIIASGALTTDNARLILDIPKALDPHMLLANELGAGVCSVKEVVEWYGKDPYNTKTFTPGLGYSICDGIDWLKEKIFDFSYPVLMLHGEKDGIVSVKDTLDFFENATSEDKQMKIYGNVLHEIFNESCRDDVISDSIKWIVDRV